MMKRSQKHFFLIALATAFFMSGCAEKAAEVVSLKDAYNGKFLMGAALNTQQSSGADSAAVKMVLAHFNSITPENCMKHEAIHPEKDRYDFTQSDLLVDFGVKNNLFVVGHTLVWHSQTAPWVFLDDNGGQVSRDTLISRMKSHIYTVVGRYKGRVNGWDVVNEAIDDTEGKGLRNSLWLQIIGPEFIDLAFQFAHEADPDAELYYNDYNLYLPFKRAEAVKIAENLKAKGLRIDAIGEQAHYGIDANLVPMVEASIQAFIGAGVKVAITELDVTVLPFPTAQMTADVSQSFELQAQMDPYREGLPDSIQSAQSAFYQDLFKVFLKYQDHVDRVTFWGVNDQQSWRNYWPIKGRVDYPLAFDRNNQPKQLLFDLVELTRLK
jgi:endo-1,4-beta-xylanase